MIPVSLVSRADTLEACAVAAEGPAACALARRTLRGPTPDLDALRGVAAPGLVVLLGAAGDLPWVDGAMYLGTDPRAPRLLLPTQLVPDVAIDVFERAVLARVPHGALVAVLPSRKLVSLTEARRIGRARLAAFAEASP